MAVSRTIAQPLNHLLMAAAPTAALIMAGDVLAVGALVALGCCAAATEHHHHRPVRYRWWGRALTVAYIAATIATPLAPAPTATITALAAVVIALTLGCTRIEPPHNPAVDMWPVPVGRPTVTEPPPTLDPAARLRRHRVELRAVADLHRSVSLPDGLPAGEYRPVPIRPPGHSHIPAGDRAQVRLTPYRRRG